MREDSGDNPNEDKKFWILCPATVPEAGIEEGEICILG